ncbi:phosphate ABC transporter permease subunit PstC [Peptoniphilus senegalensis]|uniref:phosphate ABC transporter permease subunit PstC n=3 Tax=Peptoniphilus senegalensis TaxID=1465757 RepID=UPI0003116145|nr:phosphate ABC transporter permease subunit PstC [Peptoniphilus senegalensis]
MNKMEDTNKKVVHKGNQRKAFTKEEVFKYFFLICSILSILFLLLICIFIFKDSLAFIGKVGVKNFVLNDAWTPMNVPASYGILPMIIGSVLITAMSCITAVPVSIMVACYLAFDCPKNIYRILKPALNLMTGIPSIVYGFFALTVIVPINREVFGGTGMNMLSAAILLLIMVLPTIISMAEASLRTVPQSFYQGSLSLGATHDETITRVMVPAAKSGIFAGIILGVGRAIGETMAVVLVAGNQTRLTLNPLKGIRTMTTNIVMEMAYAAGEHRQALIATAAVLFIFILLINIGFFIGKSRGENNG